MFALQMNTLKNILLGIGTNLGDKMLNINNAYQLIQTNIGNIAAKSKIYQTPPWGFNSNEDFYNSVINIESKLTAIEILIEIKKIEKQLGRNQAFKIGYSSRIIDIDIIDYAGEIINSTSLITPHPHCHNRNFVLLPLKDVDPFWVHPILNKSIENLLENQKIKSQISTVNA